MEIESGVFCCPNCGNDELWYSKWQNRIIDGEKKWIFLGSYRKPIILAPDFKTYTRSWMTALETPWYLPEFYQEPEKCWKKLEVLQKKNGMIFFVNLVVGNVNFLLTNLPILLKSKKLKNKITSEL